MKFIKDWRKASLLFLGLCPLLLASVASTRLPNARPIDTQKPLSSLAFRQYTVNLREIPATGRVTVPYSFWNRGRSEITIDKLEPSCGCLNPKLLGERYVYPPGAQGWFDVSLDMARENPGPQNYQVRVAYHDDKPREEFVTFRVTVPRRTVQVTPPELYFYQLSDHPLRSEIKVTDRRGKNLNVVEVRSPSPNLELKIGEKVTDSETSTTSIDVEVVGTLPPNSNPVAITIKTDDPEFPTIQVPVFLQGKPTTVQLTSGVKTPLVEAKENKPRPPMLSVQ